MTEFRNQQERGAAAQALGVRKPTQWTNVPPVFSGRQVEGATMAPLGRYEMPDGSNQVSFGLTQGMLDAYRSMRYGLGYEQDPNAPPGYVSQEQIEKGAWGAAGSAATGAIGAKAAARAVRRPMAPHDNKFSSFKRDDGFIVTYAGKSLQDGPDPDAPGYIYSVDNSNNRNVVVSELSPEYRGQGIGLEMYRRLIDDAHRSGRHVTSDTVVSNLATPVYDKLKDLGYDVRINPSTRISSRNGQRAARGHVYRVAKPGTPGTEFFSSGIPGLYVTEDEY